MFFCCRSCFYTTFWTVHVMSAPLLFTWNFGKKSADNTRAYTVYFPTIIFACYKWTVKNKMAKAITKFMVSNCFSPQQFWHLYVSKYRTLKNRNNIKKYKESYPLYPLVSPIDKSIKANIFRLFQIICATLSSETRCFLAVLHFKTSGQWKCRDSQPNWV